MAENPEENKLSDENSFYGCISTEWVAAAAFFLVITVLVLDRLHSRRRHRHNSNNDSSHLELDQQRQLFERDRRELQQNLNACLQANEDLQRKYDNDIRRLNTEKNRLSQNLATVQKELRAITDDYEFLKRSNKNLKDSLKKVENDKDAALKRLSKVISDRLVQNNPNIANLNDEYRPTKLAEMSNELYDNEWTTAYDCLNRNGLTDNECVNILLQILMRIHAYCQEQINGQIQALANKDVEAVSMIKETLKTKSERIRPAMYQTFFASFCHEMDQAKAGLSSMRDLQVFVENCFTLCWYMAVLDPPVVFQCIPGKGNDVTVPRGTRLSRELYREYTKRGPYIQFVVWPILFLHENDPSQILSKGVAEGCSQ